MSRQSWLPNLSLLRTYPAFHAVFPARFISITSLGLPGIVVPVQIQMMIRSTRQVGLSATPTGGAMSVSLVASDVLTDYYERKKVILLARSTRGTSFIGLCFDALLPKSSLLAIYLLGLWDGLFVSLGVTVLLAATPALIGRENLIQAGVTTMLTVRLGSMILPVIDGLLPTTGGAAWNYGLTAAGASITLLPLLGLPTLPPPPQSYEHPLKSLLVGFHFLLASLLVGGVAPLGDLLAMASTVRVLCPVLADNWQMPAAQIGFLYAVIPLGVAIGALANGKPARSAQPELLMLLSMLGSSLAIGLFGLISIWILGVVCLALFGWLSAVSLLL